MVRLKIYIKYSLHILVCQDNLAEKKVFMGHNSNPRQVKLRAFSPFEIDWILTGIQHRFFQQISLCTLLKVIPYPNKVMRN